MTVRQEHGRLQQVPKELISELPIEEIPFAELVCEFVELAHVKLHEMQQAYSDRNWSRLAMLLHWMKGSGGMAGFPALTDIARRLESSLKDMDVESVQEELLHLEETVRRLKMPSLQVVSMMT